MAKECLCPIRGIIDVVGKKWTICVVSILEKEKPIRYNQIKSILVGISPKALSDTLKTLEEEGLVSRRVVPDKPPRVEYRLTEEGEELKKSLLPLVRWVKQRRR